jgi:predicted dehydrogenase
MAGKHRIVVAGCGGMANAWVKHVLGRADAELAGFMDIRLEAAEKMARDYSLKAPVFTDLRTAITETGATLVFDVTIPTAHRDTAILAMELGCDVFTEKPLAETLEEARMSVGTARRTGKLYAVMQNRRYLRRMRAAQEFLQSGGLGKIGLTNVDFFLGTHFGGFRDAMESPLIRDMAIHTFDQARFLTGADAVRVYTREFNLPGSWYEGNASAICLFDMSDGSVLCYRGSWSSEGFHTSWEGDWRVVGEQGTLLWLGDEMPRAQIAEPVEGAIPFHRPMKEIPLDCQWQGREGHDGCLDAMFDALNQGTEPMTVCYDNIKSLAMVDAALKSAKLGIPVDVEQF